MKGKRFIEPNDVRVRGEKVDLFIGLAVLTAVFLLFVGFSLGLILIVVAVAGLYVKIHQGQLLGGAVKVSDKQLPEVHAAAVTAAERLTMMLPEVYVVQNPAINAYAVGFMGKKSVVLNSATVEAMNNDELCSILGHEFTHIKCDHTNWLVLTNLKTAFYVPVVSDVVGFIMLRWSRKAEYTCDRGSLIASRNLGASVSALGKVAVGRQLFEKLNMEALFDQRKEIASDEVSKLSEALSTHPYIVHRIHALEAYSDSGEYQKLTGIEPALVTTP